MNQPLDVLVPQGRDAHVSYAAGVGTCVIGVHAPINFHAMAAATGGAFHVSESTIEADGRAVLVLITRRAGRAYDAVKALKARGHPVLCTWKECGRHQIGETMAKHGNDAVVAELRAMADGWIVASPAARAVCTAWMPEVRWHVLPTPYPMDEAGWDYSMPLGERRGIFVGTRDWRVPSRRHQSAMRLAMMLARKHGQTHVTAVNADGIAGRLRVWVMNRGGVDCRLLEPMCYDEYLRCIAGHRIVLQRDVSEVPGQVAGDALLAGTPCLGGNGMVDGLAFGHLPGGGESDDSVVSSASVLLDDDTAWEEAVARARASGFEKVSFAAFRRLWAPVCEELTR